MAFQGAVYDPEDEQRRLSRDAILGQLVGGNPLTASSPTPSAPANPVLPEWIKSEMQKPRMAAGAGQMATGPDYTNMSPWMRSQFEGKSPMAAGTTLPTSPLANDREGAGVRLDDTSVAPGTSSRGWGLSPSGQRVEFDYSGPEGAYAPGQYRNQMEGFNADKFDPAHPEASSLKMIVGREMEGIDVNSPDAVPTLAARLNARGIRVEVVGSHNDKLHFLDTGEIVDVVRNADRVGGDPNATIAWAWMPDWAQGGASPAAGSAGGLPPGPSVAPSGATLSPALTDSDVQAEIQKAIEELIRGGVPRTAVMDELDARRV